MPTGAAMGSDRQQWMVRGWTKAGKERGPPTRVPDKKRGDMREVAAYDACHRITGRHQTP